MRFTHTKTVLCLRIAALIVLLLTGFGILSAQLSSSINKGEADALHALSEFMAAGPGAAIDVELAHLGFRLPPNIPNGTWRAFPTVRKLEAAFLMADQAAPRQGGGRMLALLSRALAQQYEPLKYDEVLKPFSSLEVAGPPMKFSASPRPLSTAWRPSTTERQAIMQLAKHTDAGPLGGVTGILDYHLGLPSDIAYEILRTSNSPEEALNRGLARVLPRMRTAKLAAMVALLDRNYPETASPIREWDPYRPGTYREATAAGPHGNSPDIGGPSTPSSAPSGPQRPNGSNNFERETAGTTNADSAIEFRSRRNAPVEWEVPSQARSTPSRAEWVNRASQAHSSFRKVNYARAGAGGFRSMVRFRGGFGGVVFGNTVRSSSTLPRLTALIWLPRHDVPETGQIQMQFRDGSIREYGPVPLEEAYAAYQIAFAGALNLDDGIGLVGVQNEGTHYGLGEKGVVPEGVRFRVVIHPALAAVGLGRSVLMSDVLPIQTHLTRLVERNEGQKPAAAMEKLFDGGIVTWKLIDAPLEIRAEGRRIAVVRDNISASQVYSDLFRHSMFLTMMGFNKDGEQPDESFSSKFDAVLPDILRSSADYDRVNQFAATLAVARWARQQRAEWRNVPAEPPSKLVPSYLVVSTAGFVPEYYVNGSEPARALLEQIDRSVEEQRRQAPVDWQEDLVSLEKQWRAVGQLSIESLVTSLNSSVERGREAELEAQIEASVAFSPAVVRTRYRNLSEEVSERLLQVVRTRPETPERASRMAAWQESQAALTALREKLRPAATDAIGAASIRSKQRYAAMLALLDRAQELTKILPREGEVGKELAPRVNEPSRQTLTSASNEAIRLERKISATSDEIAQLERRRNELRLRGVSQLSGVNEQMTPSQQKAVIAQLSILNLAMKAVDAKIEEIVIAQTEDRKQLTVIGKQQAAVFAQTFPGFERWWGLVQGYALIQ